MTSTSLSSNNFEKVNLTSLYSSTKGTNIPSKKNFYRETSSYIDKPEGGLMEKDYFIYIKNDIFGYDIMFKGYKEIFF